MEQTTAAVCKVWRETGGHLTPFHQQKLKSAVTTRQASAKHMTLADALSCCTLCKEMICKFKEMTDGVTERTALDILPIASI